MDPLVYFGLLILLMLGALYFLSLVLRNVRSARSGLRTSGSVSGTAHELDLAVSSSSSSSSSSSRRVAAAVAPDDDQGHSARWSAFVNAKLQKLVGAKPDALPGVGKSYAAEWTKRGYPTALSVFAKFLRAGPKEFLRVAEQDIGMKGNHAQDLVSGIESRWR